MTEHDIQNLIRTELADRVLLFRANVGSWQTKDGRFVSTGLPVGFPDLFGVRLSDGRALFIEVKKPGGRVRPEQEKFISKMRDYGFLAGICYSVDAAEQITSEDSKCSPPTIRK